MISTTKPLTKTADDPREIDPVCGMEIPRDAAPAELYVDGDHHYFCSEACKRRFELEPAR